MSASYQRQRPKVSRSTPVPLLLSSFPAPPSFIPTNALPSPNPPPSLPPASPLPPLPGPSPISEEETLIFISASRASKISVASSLSDSMPVPVPKSPSANVNTFGHARFRTESTTSSSVRSIHSFSSASSLSTPSTYPHTPTQLDAHNPRASVGHSISEEDPTELLRLSIDETNRATPSPMLFSEGYREHTTLSVADDSISSINMADLPPADEDDAAFDLDSAAQALHLEMRATRSKSSQHKSRIGRTIHSGNNPSQPAIGRHISKPFPSRETSEQSRPINQSDSRASSPDISTIIAATPRPQQRSTSSVGPRLPSASARRERSATPKSLPGSRRTSAASSAFAVHRRQSEGEAMRISSTDLAYMQSESDNDTYWNEESYVDDYGVVLSGKDGLEEHGSLPEAGDQNDEVYDSDSSIDLHTPLPNLMLRDGMLSPHSKILPQNSRTPSPLLSTADGGRPGSILSVASTAAGSAMTKSGIFKDERDTVKRRVRHRDGRLLRGGIGLTTGLGWSDSEDEDAPSPLTKRLSTLTLSKKSSSTSIRAHPLSRSYSAGETIHNARLPKLPKGRSSLPPTSWIQSDSNASTLSLSIRKHGSDSLPPKSSRFSEPLPESTAKDESHTPSTSSSSSLVVPSTPDDFQESAATQWDRDKTLPPLPNLRRMPSNISTRSAANKVASTSNPARPIGTSARSDSSVSSSCSIGASMGYGRSCTAPSTARSSSSSTTPRSTLTPRPLQLPSVLAAGLQPGEPAARTGLLGYNRNLHDKQRSRTASGPSMPFTRLEHAPTVPRTAPVGMDLQNQQTPSSSGIGTGRPKPRTGTGMVYRKSSNSSLPQTRMRLPSTTAQRPALEGGAMIS